jgi:hypothetical protein
MAFVVWVPAAALALLFYIRVTLLTNPLYKKADWATPAMTDSATMAKGLAVSSVNNALIGGVMFNPLNLARARLQLQHDLAPNTYKSLRHCLTKIASEDGVIALFRYGMVMSCVREATYGGAQWGLYTPFKALWGVDEDNNTSMAKKMAAGLSAGVVASLFVTPVDRLMIKQMVESGKVCPSTGRFATGLYEGKKPSYKGTLDLVQQIYRTDGVRGLWQGWEPNVVRGALITMGLTVSYDTTKELCAEHQVLEEGVLLHLVASAVSGVCASVLCAPPDIVKSRMMAAPEKYSRGPLHCVTQVRDFSYTSSCTSTIHAPPRALQPFTHLLHSTWLSDCRP